MPLQPEQPAGYIFVSFVSIDSALIFPYMHTDMHRTSNERSDEEYSSTRMLFIHALHTHVTTYVCGHFGFRRLLPAIFMTFLQSVRRAESDGPPKPVNISCGLLLYLHAMMVVLPEVICMTQY
jgi:hypothetical protein